MSEPSGHIAEPEWTREDEDAQIKRLRPIAEHLRVGHDVDPDRRRYRDTWLHIALLAEEYFVPEPADQTRADVVLSEAVVNHRSLMEVAVALCDADESWEHHDATDDHPCLRCKALAVRLAPWLAKRDTALIAARAAEHAAEVDDLADRLSDLLCNLTGGLMSKTNYSVATMTQAIEAEFEKHATADAADLIDRAEAAEATVARVKALADEYAGVIAGSSRLDPGYEEFEQVVVDLRAALDGDR